VAVADTAGPAITLAVAADGFNAVTGIDSDDTVTINFSESTNQPAITNLNIDTVLDLGATSWLDGAGNINTASWTDSLQPWSSLFPRTPRLQPRRWVIP
jgi:hypothetical protein